MSVNCKTIFNFVEEFAPLYLAEEWDNPGLQVGDPRMEVKRILLSVDVDNEICQEAIKKGAGLILCHHPLFFKPLKQLNLEDPRGALLARLLAAGTVVYAAHTNLDNAPQGVNNVLATLLGLQNVGVLRPVQWQNDSRTNNEGIIPGSGRVGDLPEPVYFGHFIQHVKNILTLSHLRYGGIWEKQIRRVAVCGGAGADLWPRALAAGAEVLVTSDIGYHAARDMQDAGLNFIDAGHLGTEQVTLPVLKEYLENRCQQSGFEVEILIASRQREPFTFY